ncbi:MAG: 50S ribosomal protein L6 [Dongiaceae bacterium]
MSRIGKNPVAVPNGVTVAIEGRKVKAKGKLGELSLPLGDLVEAKLEDGKFWVRPVDESKQARMMWGTARNLFRNMMVGVSQGYTRTLEINGVGYRAQVQGKNLVLQLGYSHDVNFAIPAGVTIKCDKPTSITVSGADRQQVGQVSAVIRGFRRPEPYKGKGIKYDTETIRRKEGKKK